MTAPGEPSPQWPVNLMANAWTGEEAASGELGEQAGTWAVTDHFIGRPESELAAQERPDLEDWADRRVGWGLVLPDNPALSYPERARADDAPAAARRLALARSAPAEPVVLRYSPGDEASLFRYNSDGTRHPLPVTGEGPRGMQRGGLPYYLLLLGSPEKLPWELQFNLNFACCTGRLDLDENGLNNYVEAAVSSWSGSRAKATSPLLWTVQHQPGDITWLMRQSVGERVLARWRDDTQIGEAACALRDEDATCARLSSALCEISPAVVVTTSHGLTSPLDDMPRMRSTLGRLVDAGHEPLDPAALLDRWDPDGVVWYALACCSAGGSGRNRFEGLLAPQTRAARVVKAVAELGPVTAEFPRLLLGAPRPARAFIGHVEPTFDWTLRRADSGLVTTASLVDALYGEFFQAKPPPVGFALRSYFSEAAALRAYWTGERQVVHRRESARSASLLAALAGIDRQCTVILGDPAVAPAALPPA